MSVPGASYVLRDRPASTATYFSPPGRKPLSPSQSATLILSPGHDCNEVKYENTAHKVMARLAFSLHRFAMAYALECTTLRGRTKYNGAVAHCGRGKCEAGHAALSPTLYDDKLERIQKELEANPWEQLSEVSQLYICKRFDLTPEDITTLSDSNAKPRLEYFQSFVRRMSLRKRKGSIAESRLELLRNATYSNPKASNRVDCHIEPHLRKKEDELANSCARNILAPEGALSELTDEYQRLLEAAHKNLVDGKDRLVVLERVWKTMIDRQALLPTITNEQAYNDMFKDYLDSVEAYLEIYHERKSAKELCVPRNKSLLNSLQEQQSPYVLQKLLKETPQGKNAIEDWFKSHQRHIRIYDATKLFQAVQLDMDQRLSEVRIQLEQLPTSQQGMHIFVKQSLGENSPNGSLITPSKDSLAHHMINVMSPAHKGPRQLKFSCSS